MAGVRRICGSSELAPSGIPRGPVVDETRAGHIDPALKAAGWGVVAGSKILREYSITPGRIEGHGKRVKVLPRLSSHPTA